MEALSTLECLFRCAVSVVLLFLKDGSAFGSGMNENSSLGDRI